MSGRTVLGPLLTLALAGGVTPLAGQQPDAAALFARANALFAQQRYAEAAAGYEATVAMDAAMGEAHLFLALSLDSQYSRAQRGDPVEEQRSHRAREHYTIAAALLVRPDQAPLLKRTLQFLAALYARDRLDLPEERVAVIERLIALDPDSPGSYMALARTHEDAGRFTEAEATLARAQAAAPGDIEVWSASAQFYNRRGDFDRTMEMLARVTDIQPHDPRHHHAMAVYYEEKVRKDFTLPPPRRAVYAAEGLAAVDRALALRPDYFEALTYKGLLLRQQALLEPDHARQKALVDEADALQARAIAVRNAAVLGQPRR